MWLVPYSFIFSDRYVSLVPVIILISVLLAIWISGGCCVLLFFCHKHTYIYIYSQHKVCQTNKQLFLATPQSLGLLLGYTKFCLICYVYVCVGCVCVCLKNASGTGLIISGDIYKYSHPHICIYKE